MTQQLLDLAGIGRRRLHLAWVSSAEAQRFVDIVCETVETLKALGPLEHRRFAMALEACEMTVAGESIRWLVGKQVGIIAKGDVYGRTWDPERYLSVLNNELEKAYQENMICLAVKAGCTSVRAISRTIGVDLMRVSYLMADLERTGRIEFKGMEDRKPVFAAL